MSRSGKSARERWLIIPATLLAALFLNIIPYPEWVRFARPDWVTLVLFYWCLALPARFGVGWGWCMGLLLDLMQYTLFGQQAVGKALVALVAVAVRRRLHLYPLWQQCVVVLLACSIDIAVVVGVFHLTHDLEFRFQYWQAALTTALLWPPACVMLRKLRRSGGLGRP